MFFWSSLCTTGVPSEGQTPHLAMPASCPLPRNTCRDCKFPSGDCTHPALPSRWVTPRSTPSPGWGGTLKLSQMGRLYLAWFSSFHSKAHPVATTQAARASLSLQAATASSKRLAVSYVLPPLGSVYKKPVPAHTGHTLQRLLSAMPSRAGH